MSEEQSAWFTTPEQQAQQALEAWRDSAVVSRLQAKAALDHSGYLEAAQEIIDLSSTPRLAKMAWIEAWEFRRMSPMLLYVAYELGISDEQLDEIFEYALTIEV